jgi:ferredoxin
MVIVNSTICNGCGECVAVCPNGAIILQHDLALIDQELCQGCEICRDACPQGAILVDENAQYGREVIQVPSVAPAEIAAVPEQSLHTPLQDAVLPAIGSTLLWTGREILPRLANLALDYLDQRIQSPGSGATNPNIQMRDRRTAHSEGNGRRRRQRQYRKRKFK